MDNGQQITQYLEEVVKVLVDLQVTIPFHMLIAGGAYMLLQQRRQSTQDIDFAVIESPQIRTSTNQVLQLTIRRAEISGKHSTIPYAAEFKQAVVARCHAKCCVPTSTTVVNEEERRDDA